MLKVTYTPIHIYLFILIQFVNIDIYAQINRQINVIDNSNIKSVNIIDVETNSIHPYIKLGGSFNISFDDLDNDLKDYYYKIEHCDAFWNTTNIIENDFIEGYNEGEINDYEYSFNTLKKFTHYSFQFPNDDMKVLISGNFLLKVYDDNVDNIVFTRKLIIYEDEVVIGVDVKRSSVVIRRETEQQVNLSINYNKLKISNPKEELKVHILQNNNWNNSLLDVKYQYISGNNFIYTDVDEVSLEAGNFYYHFDTKSVRVAGLYTDRIYLGDIYNTYLYANGSRQDMEFTNQPDFNGGYVIRNIDGANSDIEADYTKVHFALNYKKLDVGNIYVYGAFNDWKLEASNKMVYDFKTNNYKAEILLKQGYYDYKFVIADHGRIKHNIISGSYYRTENEYTVIVYHKSMNSRYYRVVGLYKIKSNFIGN